VSYAASGRKQTGAAGPVATDRGLVSDDACGRDADGQARRGDGQGEYRFMTLLSGPGCTQVARGLHGICDQPWRLETVPV
jgi:hypothetical protein